MVHTVSSASGAEAAVEAPVQKILRISCSFLRVADLGMDDETFLGHFGFLATSFNEML